jgi:beta-glucosidase
MAVRYPFGYGLSYTTFAYSNLCVSAKSMDDTEKVKVTVDVTNTGNRAGKEVVQLYVRNAPASVFRPVRELKGIEKVELAPGETKTVSFTLCKRAFAYWHAQLQDWMVETGTFGIEIARSSRDIVLCEDIEVRGTKALPQEPVSPDSIMMDLEKNPAAMAGLQPLLTAVQQALGMGGNEEKSEAASEAVTEDMGKAMMAYMPLRGLASFGNGAISYDQLKAMCDQINAQK